MQINKNSWHYRWLRLFRSEYEIPSNLCPYVRHLLGFTTLAAFFAALGLLEVMATLLTGGSFLLGHEWMLNYIGVDPAVANEDGNDWWVVIYVFGILGWIVTAFLAVVTVLQVLDTYTDIPTNLREWSEERKRSKADRPVDTSSTWYLFKQWLKATHDKVCPQISWEGSEVDGFAEQRNRMRAFTVAAVVVVTLAVWILL